MQEQILADAPVFLLIAVRAFAMIETTPLISSDANPRVAKVALAGFAAFAAFPQAAYWNIPPDMFNLYFLLLVIGEAFIGIIMGFYITMIYTVFIASGQFFTLQMGFGASETFDPLAQIENPLIGQFLYLIAMLLFLSVDGIQRLFLGGFFRSLQSLNILTLIGSKDSVLDLLLDGFTGLFLDGLIMSMPILGTLFLVSLTTGLLSKAAPQINLLTEGFPIAIMVGFIIMLVTMPFLLEAFASIIDEAFMSIQNFLVQAGDRI